MFTVEVADYNKETLWLNYSDSSGNIFNAPIRYKDGSNLKDNKFTTAEVEECQATISLVDNNFIICNHGYEIGTTQVLPATPESITSFNECMEKIKNYSPEKSERELLEEKLQKLQTEYNDIIAKKEIPPQPTHEERLKSDIALLENQIQNEINAN